MEHDAPQLLKLGRLLVIGHRGCCALAPENTLPSFKLALETGADLIELDYHHSKDGVPMVIHDETLDRTTNARQVWKRSRIKVSERTAAELRLLDAGSWFGPDFAGAGIPTLNEALELICGAGRPALIEHKSGDAQTCVRLLRERGWLNRVVVISFDWSFLRAFHELEPRQILGALGTPTRLADGEKPSRVFKGLTAARLDDLAKTGAGVVVWNRQIARAAIDLAHRQGLKVWVYTVDDARLAASLVERGVDGIITNDPGLIWRTLCP
jgi:glycerophosphoryl diester phosphodiesterase